MSFDAKKPAVRDLQLKVQELCVRASDTEIYADNAGDAEFTIGENVKEVVAVLFLDDSVPSVALKAQADISIANDVITVASTALAANDVAIIKYIVE